MRNGFLSGSRGRVSGQVRADECLLSGERSSHNNEYLNQNDVYAARVFKWARDEFKESGILQAKDESKTRNSSSESILKALRTMLRVDSSGKSKESGLPRLRQRIHDQQNNVIKVCYVGGSITEQKHGYRPALQRFLSSIHGIGHDRTVELHEIKASIGNVGSKVLNYLVDSWILDNDPDLVIIETAINDGDALIEDDDDTVNVRRAMEGIIRQIQQHIRKPDIIIVHMHLRVDVDCQRRTGTKAWTDNLVSYSVAESAYRSVLVSIYGSLSDHYSIPYVRVFDAFHSHRDDMLMDTLFRDDCHLTEHGGIVVAAIIGNSILNALHHSEFSQTDKLCNSMAVKPYDSQFWHGGQAILATKTRQNVTLTFSTPTGCPRHHHSRNDRDPLSGLPFRWTLLGVGDYLQVEFEGSSLALLTYSGPDSGMVHADIQPLDDSANNKSCELHFHRQLFDKWSYYYRQTVCVLAESLPPKRYSAKVWIDDGEVDKTITKRPTPKGVQGNRKLWLSYILIREN